MYLPPDAAGLIADWPAWWMVGYNSRWPNHGEIDLMEGLGGTAAYHFHYGQASPGYGPGGSVPSTGPGWHTFGVDWQPALDAPYPVYVLSYYYDGTYAGSIVDPQASGELTAAPMELLFDITNTTGNTDPAVPATMQVAYARAWTGSNGAVPLSIDSDRMCMDDWHSGTANKTKVDLYTCNGTAAQSWLYNPADHAVHLALGGCLDVYNSDTASGSIIDRYTCNGSGAQQWDLGPDGSLVNPESGRCLTDPGGSETNGTQLEISTCNGAADQDWLLSNSHSTGRTAGPWRKPAT